ncbi:MAG TPA: minichromosome maintenance protein MCM, partial [Candidatus Thermoplasmatota archaeon]|nr:minichromosome maintenance protein MCM [Candidatus Thermoplasmatota archaeon]
PPPPPSAEAEPSREGGLSEEPQVRSWERFFKTYYREAINEAMLGWPARRSLAIDFFHLQSHDENLAEFVLNRPYEALAHAQEALKSIDIPGMDIAQSVSSGTSSGALGRPRLAVRVTKLPVTHTVDVRELRAEHLGKLISLKGLVKKTTEVRPKLQDAVFICSRCGNAVRVPQDEHLVLQEPQECYEDQGGCGREAKFKLIVGQHRGQGSLFVDTQKLEIQEAPENMRGGEQPQRLSLFAEDDLCGLVRPGERVTFNGVLRSAVRKDHGVKSTIFDLYLEVNSVEKHEQEFEEIMTTEEEEAEIRRFARDPEIYEKMRDSIAPSLFGMSMEKLMLLLQLFGGVEKRLPDKTRLRGDLHVLLVGDPGVAKSQLIRYMAGLAPRGIYTSGKSSSGAGLTAAAVKDEFGEGRWTLEAGAMVLADRGLLCVDEIDKMDKNDQSSMHEGMEQQSISVAKAGITATLQSRCSVLGAANPKSGRFDEFTPIAEQINFPPALLSRFDVIFVLQDKPKVEHDSNLARHILNVHRGGAMLEQLRHDETLFTEEQATALLQKVEPALARDLRGSSMFKDTKEFLRKYVAYAKRTCHPVLSEDARDKLAAYYVELRRSAGGEESKAIPLTARQLEALVRISEASARVRLAKEVTLEDAERAIGVYEYYMRRLGSSEGGIMDVDMVASGVSANQRNSIGTVKQVIRDLEARDPDGAEWGEVVRECERKGVPLAKVEEIVKRLKQQGEVYQGRTDNHLKLV